MSSFVVAGLQHTRTAQLYDLTSTSTVSLHMQHADAVWPTCAFDACDPALRWSSTVWCSVPWCSLCKAAASSLEVGAEAVVFDMLAKARLRQAECNYKSDKPPKFCITVLSFLQSSSERSRADRTPQLATSLPKSRHLTQSDLSR